MTESHHERKRQTQGGVQAIFTIDHRGYGDAVPAVGLLALGGGVAIWLWALRNLNTSNGVNISQAVASSTLDFASLGMLLVLAGTGLAAYSLAERRTRVGRNMRAFSPHSKSPDPGFTSESSDKDRPKIQRWDSAWKLKSTHPISNTFVAALVQSLVYIGSYGGLVMEYNNNTRMHAWVQNNLPLIGYMLNYYGVLLLSGLLGVFVVHFLPKKQSSR